jgi:NAD-dependent dihydropyrimidine dehydrogenase PreA subunit
MNSFKLIWGTLFRLFPCPIPTGLTRIGNPDHDSPVLVTCNFYLTVRRLMRNLRESDVWLLVVDSKGVNVWCAAGGEEFNTRSVVSAVRTSGISDLVDHRTLILPPLGAPGIRGKDIEDQIGWFVRWGPVRAKDIPLFLASGQHRSEEMKRVTYSWIERLDTALGSLFPFYLIGAIGFLVFGRQLLLHYLLVGIAAFLFFMLSCPWLPGKRGLTKAIFLNVVLGLSLVTYEVLDLQSSFSIRAVLIISMVMLLLYGSELGGLASDMPSDLDPFLARMGIGAIGNVALAGTIRTDLLNESRVLKYYRDCCIGCRNCSELCPQGVWKIDEEKRAVFAHTEDCTACRACLVQCEGGAIEAELKSVG